jgi:hypothetical protein
VGAVGYTYEDVLASLAGIGGRDESELIKQTPLADNVADRVVGRRRRETTIKGTFEMSAFPSSTVIVRYATAATRPIRWGLRDGAPLAALIARAQTLEAACVRWLIAYSIAVLRISVGAVFLGFGVLKFGAPRVIVGGREAGLCR